MSESPVLSRRIKEIEVLRGLAFAAVVFQHTMAHYGADPAIRLGDGVLLALLVLLSKFAVPVFIFITGVLMFYNYQDEMKYGKFYAKRAKDIGVPFLLWSIFYITLNHAWEGNNLQGILSNLEMIITGKSSYHLWYVFMIIQFYLLFPLFRKLVLSVFKRLSARWRTVAVIGSGIAYTALLPFIFTIMPGFERANIPGITALFTIYADRNALYYLFYFVLGAAAGLHIEHWRNVVKQTQFLYGTVFTVYLGWFLYHIVEGFQTGDGIVIQFEGLALLRPAMAIFLTSSILVYYRLAMYLSTVEDRFWVRCISGMGMLSYGAYLMHAGVLRLSFAMEGWWLVEWSVTIRTLVAFLLCVLMCCLFTWLLALLLFGKWVVGSHLSVKSKHNRNEIPNSKNSRAPRVL
ncbi:surface polysaccharide O-acyltransferase-like enzyme [Paenibacillus shirakamiensis]|uniref:Surface polysaccharide O-acyltransferase-like enzyme n=1 Tax=Paenibacillus shirakamiensis TaxID=1265935 RepID=A0ABS4JFV0_9BACL|nr:acyltransferase [Paenibacillus shirakamiensis]MBP2000583.1 surface polysaccharide O-acyltransferase-like enzyme [Paenibacillus shirakamiensis]